MAGPLSPEDAAKVEKLVAVFKWIAETRMKDMPLVNPAIEVEAIGFRRWENWLAGILITPWFMNFMLLPTDPAQMAGKSAAHKEDLELPRGLVKFTIGDVEEIGLYLASSLYSPMRDFNDHALARTTAWAAVEKFFVAAEEDQPIACGMSPTEGHTPNPH